MLLYAFHCGSHIVRNDHKLVAYLFFWGFGLYGSTTYARYPHRSHRVPSRGSWRTSGDPGSFVLNGKCWRAPQIFHHLVADPQSAGDTEHHQWDFFETYALPVSGYPTGWCAQKFLWWHLVQRTEGNLWGKWHYTNKTLRGDRGKLLPLHYLASAPGGLSSS